MRKKRKNQSRIPRSSSPRLLNPAFGSILLVTILSFSWGGSTDAFPILRTPWFADRDTHCRDPNGFSRHRHGVISVSDDDVYVNEGNPDYSGPESSSAPVVTRTTSFGMTASKLAVKNKSRLRPSLLSRMGRKFRFWKQPQQVESATLMQNDTATVNVPILNFTYEFDTLELIEGRGGSPTSSQSINFNTTGIVLIHPIGVGIAKWFYQRLFSSLSKELDGVSSSADFEWNRRDFKAPTRRLVVVAPDLLGSGSACNANITSDGHSAKEFTGAFPLFNISDWTDQVMDLMAKVDANNSVDQWCVVANGGCSPIALQVAARSIDVSSSPSSPSSPSSSSSRLAPKVSNVILSTVPRLPFFLPPTDRNDPGKVERSYRTLCGITGKIFWWYACRNHGSFIQKFSERNLVADPRNLGPTWQSNCFETATANGGRSKYSTFAFLAGTLQDGCAGSLRVLRDSPVRVDVIKGADIRRNKARSWFWQRKKPMAPVKHEDTNSPIETNTTTPYETTRDYLEKNGNGGNEAVIGGRVSLAHEDSDGYAKAIIKFLL